MSEEKKMIGLVEFVEKEAQQTRTFFKFFVENVAPKIDNLEKNYKSFLDEEKAENLVWLKTMEKLEIPQNTIEEAITSVKNHYDRATTHWEFLVKATMGSLEHCAKFERIIHNNSEKIDALDKKIDKVISLIDKTHESQGIILQQQKEMKSSTPQGVIKELKDLNANLAEMKTIEKNPNLIELIQRLDDIEKKLNESTDKINSFTEHIVMRAAEEFDDCADSRYNHLLDKAIDIIVKVDNINGMITADN